MPGSNIVTDMRSKFRIECEQIANGRFSERPQDPARAQTYRTPDYRAIRELRRRVAARRLERAGVGVGTGLGEAS